jgi:hypothetical protein
MNLRQALAVISVSGLVACGGGGGSSNTATERTGVFLDSAVEGLNYRTATRSGQTNASGEFLYVDGETITFSIGSIDLPEVEANSTLTPLDLAGTTEVGSPVVSNILVLLQSLDADGDPGNGIKILDEAHIAASAVTNEINFDVATTTFRANPSVVALVTSSGSVNSSLVTVDAATSHFQSTLASNNVAPVANAGPNQIVLVSSGVTLDGSGSSDANDDTLTYLWTLKSKPSSSAASLPEANAVKTTFVPDVAGSYVFSLVVSDGELSSRGSVVSITAGESNLPPVADAGVNQNVSTSSVVKLNGALSSDANGDSLSYAWTLVSKPAGISSDSAASLSNADTVNPSFTADKAGTYVIRLIVNDGTLDSEASTVTIVASDSNIAPVANAGPDQNVSIASSVYLDGSASSDANGDLLSYTWTITSKPNGSSASLSSSSVVNPSFTADKAGTYVLSLKVSDGILESNVGKMTVTASSANIAPIANAGMSQNVVVGATVTLDGSGSSDANGDSITYAWSVVSKPEGSSATLANATTVNPTFVADVAGSFILRLVANDGLLSSGPSTVLITSSSSNIAPVASAGVAQSVLLGSTVTLDGTSSNDANGDQISYLWTVVSKPSGSIASLSNTTAAKPTFVVDRAGSYVMSLTVNDGTLNSNSSTVTITASNANLPPVANAGGGLNVYVGTTVTLNGTESYDPNGDPIDYGWALVSKPLGSAATLFGPDTSRPSFTPDVAGSYVVNLVVGDGSLVSQSSSVIITASAIPVVTGVELLLYGGADNSVYLGCLTCNQSHAESVCNSFGTYGNTFSASSIWNSFGTYGNSFSLYSPWNSFSLSGPIVLGTDGLNYGYFTTNSFKVGRTTIQGFLNVLNFYSSTNNLTATRSYACGN